VYILKKIVLGMADNDLARVKLINDGLLLFCLYIVINKIFSKCSLYFSTKLVVFKKRSNRLSYQLFNAYGSKAEVTGHQKFYENDAICVA